MATDGPGAKPSCDHIAVRELLKDCERWESLARKLAQALDKVWRDNEGKDSAAWGEAGRALDHAREVGLLPEPRTRC